MQEIKITDIENVKIGNIEDKVNATGCTVLLFENGACAGLSVEGGGPASRESELLKPLASCQSIHAILLSGGSAYGLDAAGGVMQFLEEHNIGFDVGVAKVPLVCQSCLFDLGVQNAFVRPDKKMGYDVCLNAQLNNYHDGNYGAGTGASVGKMLGMDFAMKTGVGSYALQIGELKIGAIVALNALGDIYDEGHLKIAGVLGSDKTKLGSIDNLIAQSYEVIDNKFVGNTTLGVVLCNAKFDKSQLCKIAAMGHDGYARAISPVHTSADGDSIYAVSLGDVKADIDVVGTLGATVLHKAIINAVYSAKTAYGLKANEDLLK